MSSFLRIALLASAAALVVGKAGIFDQIEALQSSGSNLIKYPTQVTQGIIPKWIHSHNDYWRDVPLLTAISYGATSVEADVFLVDGTLYIGHEVAALTRKRTLDSLYIQPLLRLLNAQNPTTEFTRNQTNINGVFDTASGRTLFLFVDFKSDGVLSLPVALRALEPLRQAGYLTTALANGTIIPGAVTVIGTGSTPLEGVKSLSERDFFFDGPLAALSDTATNTTWNPSIAPIASTNYDLAVGWNGVGSISETQLANLQKLVSDAHTRGITARFWNTPGWPIQARNNVWQVLWDNGADWLNADDLEAASLF